MRRFRIWLRPPISITRAKKSFWSNEETHDFLEKRWSHRVRAYSDDFTNKEAVAAIVRITKGNIRLIERLMMQVEHVLVAKQLQVVTKEVVEAARQNLIIGPG